MSSAARTTRPPAAPPVPPLTAFGRPVRRVSLAEYHRMIDAGVFVGGPKCELIYGVLLEKPVPGPPHASTTRRVHRRLLPFYPEPDWVVGVQDSITLGESEPEPDVFIAVGPESQYADRHPGPKDLVLVVEVSHSSLEFDRGTKLALHAGAKVVQYWIVDVEARRVAVYTRPRGGRSPAYRDVAEYGVGDAVPVVVGGRAAGSVAVSALLS